MKSKQELGNLRSCVPSLYLRQICKTFMETLAFQKTFMESVAYQMQCAHETENERRRHMPSENRGVF